ncbi:DMT family transporter [Castellaniella sp. S9]|uniref:DMT family transporter n=1 Tax=Castellaniella sp. S9 TaxID=2993652 RepID=UPI0022B481C1|nr:DMT family transporter [Castellaniella sp. S9]
MHEQQREVAARERKSKAHQDAKPANAQGVSHVTWRATVLGAAFSLFWASAFAAAKVAVVDAPSLLLLTLRFLVSGIIAVALARALGQRIPRDRRTWLAIGTLGISQNAIYLGLIFIAIREVPSAFAAIIASALPLAVATTTAALGRERLNLRAALGLACGAIGVVAVLYERVVGGVSMLGIVLCLGSLGALTFATMIVNRARFDRDLLMIVGLQMFVGGLAIAPFGIVFESPDAINFTLELALSFAHLVLIPGLLATFVWFRLIQWIGPTRASVFHFLNPGFAVAIAWVVLDEPLTSGTVIGMTLVALGILLVQTARLEASAGSR